MSFLLLLLRHISFSTDTFASICYRFILAFCFLLQIDPWSQCLFIVVIYMNRFLPNLNSLIIFLFSAFVCFDFRYPCYQSSGFSLPVTWANSFDSWYSYTFNGLQESYYLWIGMHSDSTDRKLFDFIHKQIKTWQYFSLGKTNGCRFENAQ